MGVSIDNRRHDGLAGQVHASRARGHLHLTGFADLAETAVVDDECGVLDGRTVIARNEPRPLEHRHACRGRRLLGSRRRTGGAKQRANHKTGDEDHAA